MPTATRPKPCAKPPSSRLSYAFRTDCAMRSTRMSRASPGWMQSVEVICGIYLQSAGIKSRITPSVPPSNSRTPPSACSYTYELWIWTACSIILSVWIPEFFSPTRARTRRHRSCPTPSRSQEQKNACSPFSSTASVVTVMGVSTSLVTRSKNSPASEMGRSGTRLTSDQPKRILDIL